jgi:hypothetical protein
MSDRELLAAWMVANGFMTGHGDTVADLLNELTWQVVEERAKLRFLREESLVWRTHDR